MEIMLGPDIPIYHTPWGEVEMCYGKASLQSVTNAVP